MWAIIHYILIHHILILSTTHTYKCKFNNEATLPKASIFHSHQTTPLFIHCKATPFCQFYFFLNFFYNFPRIVGYGEEELWRSPCNKLSSCWSRKCHELLPLYWPRWCRWWSLPSHSCCYYQHSGGGLRLLQYGVCCKYNSWPIFPSGLDLCPHIFAQSLKLFFSFFFERLFQPATSWRKWS